MLPLPAGREASPGGGAFRYARRPAIMGQVLGIVYRGIATHLIKKAGFSRKTAQAGAVTLIQRFGSALNLNIHFHMLFLDGVYVQRPDGSLRFRWVKAPTSAELTRLAQTLALRVGRLLERQGLLERDVDDCMDAGDRATQEAKAEARRREIAKLFQGVATQPWAAPSVPSAL